MGALRAILRGVASILDIGGTLGPTPDDVRRPGETGAQADARALASDWRAAGDDMRAAMDRMDRMIAEGRRQIRRH